MGIRRERTSRMISFDLHPKNVPPSYREHYKASFEIASLFRARIIFDVQMHGSARKGTAGLTLASSIEWKDDDRRHAIQEI